MVPYREVLSLLKASNHTPEKAPTLSFRALVRPDKSIFDLPAYCCAVPPYDKCRIPPKCITICHPCRVDMFQHALEHQKE